MEYRIHLHHPDGSVRERRADFADDDAAIDHAGGIAHWHDIRLWRGERLVAHFPPWPGPSPLGRRS